MAGALQERSMREELLADIDGDGSKVKQWLERPLDGPGYSSFGEQYGFHPAFTSLVAGFAPNPSDEESKAFVRKILAVMPSGADTLDIVRTWFAAVWSSQELGLESKLAGTSALAEASGVIRLVEQSRDESVSPRTWRGARSTLGNLAALPAEAAEYVPVVLAMCWDLEQVPGASQDVVTAWARAISRIELSRGGWTDEEGQELERLTLEMHEQARDAADQSDAETLRRTFTEALQKLQQTTPRFGELSAKMKACRDQVQIVQQQWAEQARASFVSAAESARSC